MKYILIMAGKGKEVPKNKELTDSIQEARRNAYEILSKTGDSLVIGRLVKENGKTHGKYVGQVFLMDLGNAGHRIVWNTDSKKSVGAYKVTTTYLLNKDGTLGECLDPFVKIERSIKRKGRL